MRLEIHDRGPGDPMRWTIVATDENGRMATGNPEADLDTALAVVHWFDLDDPAGR